MKSIATNLIHGFLGGFIAAAVWSIVTNFMRFGSVPLDAMLFGASLTGCTYAIVFAFFHSVCKLKPSLVSSSATALATMLLGVGLSICIGTFVGWSFMSITGLLILSRLIGCLTYIFVDR